MCVCQALRMLSSKWYARALVKGRISECLSTPKKVQRVSRAGGDARDAAGRGSEESGASWQRTRTTRGQAPVGVDEGREDVYRHGGGRVLLGRGVSGRRGGRWAGAREARGRGGSARWSWAEVGQRRGRGSGVVVKKKSRRREREFGRGSKFGGGGGGGAAAAADAGTTSVVICS